MTWGKVPHRAQPPPASPNCSRLASVGLGEQPGALQPPNTLPGPPEHQHRPRHSKGTGGVS